MERAAAPLPVGLLQWIADHEHEFRPPVSNRVIWPDGDLMAMVVRGPNARTDFHDDPGDELFLQLRGAIRVDVIEDGEVRERWVREGEIMLVPGHVPHRPLRPAGTWGLVVERRRAAHELDRVFWRCDTCGAVVDEVTFHVTDIEGQLADALGGHAASEERRTCGGCGTVAPVPAEFTGEAP
jgi:3-hydroxyanthranilate 3,4-dioxygenase